MKTRFEEWFRSVWPPLQKIGIGELVRRDDGRILPAVKLSISSTENLQEVWGHRADVVASALRTAYVVYHPVGLEEGLRSPSLFSWLFRKANGEVEPLPLGHSPPSWNPEEEFSEFLERGKGRGGNVEMQVFFGDLNVSSDDEGVTFCRNYLGPLEELPAEEWGLPPKRLAIPYPEPTVKALWYLHELCCVEDYGMWLNPASERVFLSEVDDVCSKLIRDIRDWRESCRKVGS